MGVSKVVKRVRGWKDGWMEKLFQELLTAIKNWRQKIVLEIKQLNKLIGAQWTTLVKDNFAEEAPVLRSL